ncbi:hypothetical protein Bca52824_064995 [Brassica carinata]|uniref:Uncharacterized protein n=1 Tax=Brassica carinata TaxID=52824 RepID=A0A8X7QHL3_BRACI|nr:hypothetical protein Bca52824_064995 [Brassica carinata]
MQFVRNEEEQAVERIEGNGGVRAPSLGPTENGQIDFKEISHLGHRTTVFPDTPEKRES